MELHYPPFNVANKLISLFIDTTLINEIRVELARFSRWILLQKGDYKNLSIFAGEGRKIDHSSSLRPRSSQGALEGGKSLETEYLA
jgi:hypothetical protein